MEEVGQDSQLQWIHDLLQHTIDGGILRLGIKLQDKVEAIPAYLGLVRTVRELIITQNESLRRLPTTIGEMSEKLTYLELHHNALTSLPDEIGHLTNLTYLDVSHNQLATLPYGIGQLQSLRHLDVSHNAIEHYPWDMLQLEPRFMVVNGHFEGGSNRYLPPDTAIRPPIPGNADVCSQCAENLPVDLAGDVTGLSYVAFLPYAGTQQRLPFVHYTCDMECFKDCHKMLFLAAVKAAANQEEKEATWEEQLAAMDDGL
mmetsp:Transcript_101260/g.174878  ORF Transcript_101260/g.174878 Transcript_101260/m.174878 type:complete len:258 (-) Transcript_101260:38-811(-)